ncbi:alpha-amylase [Cnuella takakiae]|nr:alpha-amylase [Cnuella takakiae]
MNNVRGILLGLLLLAVCTATAQTKVYPTHWWIGMKNPALQLMVYAPNAGKAQYTLNYPGVKLVKVHKAESPNYAFLDLQVTAGAKPGTVKIAMRNGAGQQTINYQLKSRRAGNGTAFATGVRQQDLIYLLMPDRFANGDPANDAYADMLDPQADRNNPYLRHGGDIQGVIQHLDYLKELGVTALWMTPVTENNTKQTNEGGTQRSSYHGYHFTNHFAVDKRFGGDSAYKRLSDEMHKRGMKLVHDAVYNHIGQDNFTFTDMPMKDWVNQWSPFQQTSYRDQPLFDPHASAIDQKVSEAGWFTPFLPDLNQRNPYVANYLVQYLIWNTEEYGLDGWRVDTYFYNDPEFLNRTNRDLLREFPKLTVFGETLVESPVSAAYFGANNFNVPFKHNVMGITDKPLMTVMVQAANEPFGWSEGVNRLYNTLAQDFMYQDPTRNCIFLDNHDLDRVYSLVGEDIAKYKMVLNWLLTLRGIPQLYYGTEILMKNFKNPSDAEVRRDFPGGFKGDKDNKFTEAGRNKQENDAFRFVSTLAKFRQRSDAIGAGKLMQFLPDNGLYTYFRYSPKQTVMVISHTGKADMQVKMDRFAERTKGFTQMRDVQSGLVKPLADFTIRPKESFVYEFLP